MEMASQKGVIRNKQKDSTQKILRRGKEKKGRIGKSEKITRGRTSQIVITIR